MLNLGVGGPRWPQRARVIAWLAAVAATGLVSAACNTTAEIAFTVVQPDDLYTIGTINTTMCTGTDATPAVRVVITDTQNNLLEPGAGVGGVAIEVGDTLSDQDFTFTSSVLYPSPDVGCGTDADCVDVGTGFTCQALSDRSDAPRVCGLTTQVETTQGSLSYQYEDEPQEKRIVLAMDYGRTLLGFDTSVDPPRVNPDLSSDFRDQRIAGAFTFLERLENSPYAEGTELCVSSFAGLSVGGVLFLPTIEDCFVSIEGGRTELQTTVNGLGRNESQQEGRAVWAALLRATEELSNQGDGFGRHIVIFADGPDTGSLAEAGQTQQAVVQAALAAGVRVHILQLDNRPSSLGGSIGPIDEYAQVACDTGGSYQYASNPEDLRTLFRNLGFGLPAHYELNIDVPIMATVEPGAYRLATTLAVVVGDREVSTTFSGYDVQEGTQQIQDTRLTLFRRPVPPRPDQTPDGSGEGP